MNILASGAAGAVRRLAMAPVPLPKLVECWREGYSVRLLAADLMAGVTVGLVALPLAMAFAIASGLPPQTGLYCGAIAGFTISALGGSRVQIGGPTGAFVVVVSGIVATYGLDGLFMCTLMAGAMLILLGITGLGTAVKYIPRPVVIGFTNGIAILIASTQIRDLFGLQTPPLPGEFLGRLRVLAVRRRNRVRRRHPAGARHDRGHSRMPPCLTPHSRQHHRAAGRFRSSSPPPGSPSTRSDHDSAWCRAAFPSCGFRPSSRNWSSRCCLPR